jgi:uncharacterized membrane protein YdjX (TVP38/TMEM64 family)
VSDGGDAAPVAPPPTRWTRGRLVILALLAVVVVLAAMKLPLRHASAHLVSELQGAGGWGMALFVLAFVVACVLLVPSSALSIAAGAAWGTVVGSLLAIPGSTLGAVAACLVARTIARPWARRRLASRPVVAAIDRAVGQRGFQTVVLLRLAPILPYNLLNIVLGLSSVRLRDFALGSLLGMLPLTILCVHAGAVAATLAGITDGGRPPTHARIVMLVVGLVATLIVVVLVTRRARRELAKILA